MNRWYVLILMHVCCIGSGLIGSDIELSQSIISTHQENDTQDVAIPAHQENGKHDVAASADKKDAQRVVAAPVSQEYLYPYLAQLNRVSVVEEQESEGFQCSSFDCDNKTQQKAGGACVALTLIGCALGFGLGFAPYEYKVYNRESYPIIVNYRPGCTKTVTSKNSKTTTESQVPTDCHNTVFPNDYGTIYSAGKLTKLCAQYGVINNNDDIINSFEAKCTTNKALSDGKDFSWYVHGNLIFTRGDGKYHPLSNVTNSKLSWNGTDSTYINDLVVQSKPYYLRGSLKNNRLLK